MAFAKSLKCIVNDSESNILIYGYNSNVVPKIYNYHQVRRLYNQCKIFKEYKHIKCVYKIRIIPLKRTN